MGALKRLVLIVFVIASLLGVGFLTVFWLSWQPLLGAVQVLNAQSWFVVVELVLLGIFLVGILTIFVWALVTPGRSSELHVGLNDGEVTISREAIISTAQHVLKKHRGLNTESVRVKIRGKRNPKLRLRIKIDPGRNGNLTNLGTQLHNEVVSTIESFSGHPVDRVRISFVKTNKSDAYQQFAPLPTEPSSSLSSESVLDTASETFAPISVEPPPLPSEGSPKDTASVN